MNDLISVIMPAYNAESYISKAIESVLQQTYKNWELLIINDNSSDNTLNIIGSYLYENRIKVFNNHINLGPARSRNIGLDHANGKYITFLDADDFIDKEKFQVQLSFMKENKISMSHGNYIFCNNDGYKIKKVSTDIQVDYFSLLKGNQFKIMTVLIEKDSIDGIRFPDIKHEDYAFYLECLKKIPYSLSQSQRFDSYVRIGNISVSSNKIKSALWTWDIYYKYEKLG
ncbi:glycosyltransferase family 2 protein, partial [Ursidibacter maritimus]